MNDNYTESDLNELAKNINKLTAAIALKKIPEDLAMDTVLYITKCGEGLGKTLLRTYPEPVLPTNTQTKQKHFIQS